ncbi:hypothetical protein L2E82_18590 [Cichorium intybus]|uniref:Uncharacterized protein n=1 Tax=Cichorium intybus TaxID=13427 RepID=A0ACB9FA44_CICIN|nr:hypothetical protein L2E82_18590 [Cichorium intybus]
MHRDIKSTHILIDNDNIPKLIDFGTAVHGNRTMFHCEQVLGTEPYIAVEYKSQKKLTTKADIFSCGVVLLEIISTRVPTPQEGMTITEWATTKCFLEIDMERDADVSGMFDPFLLASIPIDDRVRIVRLAADCIHPDPSKRPDSAQLVARLLAMSCLTQAASSSTT